MPRYICILVFETSVRIGKNLGLYNLESSFIYSVGCFWSRKINWPFKFLWGGTEMEIFLNKMHFIISSKQIDSLQMNLGEMEILLSR